MAKVNFKIDIEKDAWNYWRRANSGTSYGYDFKKKLDPKIIKKLKCKEFEEVKKEIVIFLKEKFYNSREINKKIKIIRNNWKKVEKKYFDKLEKITKHEIYTNKFTCYITTLGRCPYNPQENWFMTNISWSEDMIVLTVAHELMHLQFHHYYEKKLLKEISKEQFHDIKEALTVLLNIEFSDLIKSKDLGYPKHQKLRKFIQKEWEKEKDFDLLIKKLSIKTKLL